MQREVHKVQYTPHLQIIFLRAWRWKHPSSTSKFYSHTCGFTPSKRPLGHDRRKPCYVTQRTAHREGQPPSSDPPLSPRLLPKLDLIFSIDPAYIIFIPHPKSPVGVVVPSVHPAGIIDRCDCGHSNHEAASARRPNPRRAPDRQRGPLERPTDGRRAEGRRMQGRAIAEGGRANG